MYKKNRTYRKRNKSSRSRKNKITRRYKKQMRGGINLEIKNKTQLKESWDNTKIKSWLAYDGHSTQQKYFREGYEYGNLEEQMQYYLKNINNKGAYIRAEIE